MDQKTIKTENVFEKITLLFFVLTFSFSNLSFFNMLLKLVGYEGNVTVISSIIYSIGILLIAIYFLKYVINSKTYKMLAILICINLVYILPNLINFNIKNIILYIMFPLPMTLMAGIMAMDSDVRKKVIWTFYKLRYVYLSLGVLYLIFLEFFSKNTNGELPDFTYGNVAWFFLPAIFIYIGIFFEKEFSKTVLKGKKKLIELLIIISILMTVIFYTGLRSGIISLFFTAVVNFFSLILLNRKNYKNYLKQFLIILVALGLIYLLSNHLMLNNSRLNFISDNFLWETNERPSNNAALDVKKKKTKTDFTPLKQYVEELEATKQPKALYAKENIDLYSPTTKQKIGEIQIGDIVEGEILDDFINISVNNEIIKIEADKFIYKAPKPYYINASEDIYNNKFEIIDKAFNGKFILAVEIGNYYCFNENGTRFIGKDFVQQRPRVLETCTIDTTNVYDINTNKIIGVYSIGDYIAGMQKDDDVFIFYQDDIAKVDASMLKLAHPEWLYINEDAPILNNKFEEIGTAYKGKPIYAVLIGDYYRFSESGVKFVIKDVVQKEPVQISSYRLSNFNIIDAEDNTEKTVEQAFKKYFAKWDKSQEETEKILSEDILNDNQKYLIAKEQFRFSISNFELNMDRANLWSLSLAEIKKAPIFGQGPMFFHSKYKEYFPHNIILEILTDFGIVGLIIVSTFIIFLFIQMLKALKKQRDNEMLLLMLFCISYLPSYLLYETLYNNNTLIFAITLFLIYIVFNKKQSKTIQENILDNTGADK